MAERKPRVTLSDRQARGGVIGGRGYGFQAAYIVSRIPLWLGDTAFVQWLQEGAGDVDVRFNRDGREERLYIQVKNYRVGTSTARKVLQQFRAIDVGTPGTYTRFILACPGLNNALKSVCGEVEDVRGVTDFYGPHDAILKNTWDDLRRTLAKLDLRVDAEFLVGKVYFDTDMAGLADDTSLRDLFVGRLLRLEQWRGLTPEEAAHAYEKLALRAHRVIRLTCNRNRIETEISNAVEELPAKQAQLRDIPSLPNPYLTYRYPMPDNWVGRHGEMDWLDRWLEKDGAPMCCMVGIGGMGKSSLAWAWLHQRVMAQQEALQLAGIFYCSFYEGETGFRRFLDDLCAYLGMSYADDPVMTLVQRLAETRVLLVLDGFERLLGAYASMDAELLPERTAAELKLVERCCADLATARFLRALAADTACKALLTSRLVPQELDRLNGWRLLDLRGLAPDDAVDYMRAKGIRGTRIELRGVAEKYDFHPLSLSKLVEVLHYDVSQPDDVRQAPRYNVAKDLQARQHHILQRAHGTLPLETSQLLDTMAAMRGKLTMDIVRFLSGDMADERLSANLRRLEEHQWIAWERGQKVIDLHPVVRLYAYGQLSDKVGTHTRLRDYFAAVGQPAQVNTLNDLTPTIELYHHTVRAGHCDDALSLLRDRLIPNPLHYRFAAFQLIIELMQALFPGGEPLTPSTKVVLPLLHDKKAQSWTLHALATSYALSGQPNRAVPLYEATTAMSEDLGETLNLATALGAVASVAYRPLGALAAAERNHRRRIAICRELKDKFGECVGHEGLGHVLSYTGAVEESRRELKISSEYWEQTDNTQGLCVNDTYRALGALLMGDADAALQSARQAHKLALDGEVERDCIRALWILGASHRAKGHQEQAYGHLSEALRRCRRAKTVEFEPDILLELAHIRRVRGESEEAGALASEALEISDRCAYRMNQADCHRFLGRLLLDKGEPLAARTHAEVALERAECDGPPHRYEMGFQEAQRLLEEIEAFAP